MGLNYSNIPYQLPEAGCFNPARFLSIWKVEVNQRYREFKPNGLGHPGIFLTYEGEGHFYTYGDEPHVLKEHSVFLFDGNTPCRYHCGETGVWKFYFIHFHDLESLQGFPLPVASVFQTSLLEPVSGMCERLIRCIIQTRFGAGLEASALFQELLLLLARERIEEKDDKRSNIARVLYWMHQNIEKPIGMDDLIHLSGMSRTLFFRCFKAEIGQSPTTYFNRLKLESACIALQSTTDTVKEIAEFLHFCDEFHFSKLFKQAFGEAPIHYRNRRRNTQVE